MRKKAALLIVAYHWGKIGMTLNRHYEYGIL